MMKVFKLSVSETSYPILFVICVIMKSPLKEKKINNKGTVCRCPQRCNILSFQGKESIF